MNNQRTVQIRQRAFELWELEHCPEGHHLKHWLCAEAEFAAEIEAESEAAPDSADPQVEESSAVAEAVRRVARQETSGAV